MCEPNQKEKPPVDPPEEKKEEPAPVETPDDWQIDSGE